MIRVVARAVALRCAYCHDDLESGRGCPACRTQLHEDCWGLAGACPTLGCRPVVRVVLPEASWEHLVWWLLTFAAVWGALVGIVPRFDAMYRETGLSLAAPTEIVLAASRFADSGPGALFGVGVVVGSVALLRRHRRRAALRRALVVLTLAGFASLPFGAFGLFLSLVQLGGRL